MLTLVIAPVPFTAYVIFCKLTGTQWLGNIPAALSIGVTLVTCVLLAHRLMRVQLQHSWEWLMQQPAQPLRRSGLLGGEAMLATSIGSFAVALFI